MISKIAIFRALHLGDMLCIIPTARAIRAAWPNADICLIGLPWQQEFARRFNQYFDHFLEFPGYPGLPEQATDPEKVIDFLRRVRACGFDLVFQMQGNGEITNSLCMLWGARQVCGLRKQGEFAPMVDMFPISEDTDHEVTRFFKLLSCLNVTPQGDYLEFPLEQKEKERAAEMIKACGLASNEYVCLHPGARDVRRRWPLEKFAHIGNEVSSMGIPLMLTGSGEEADLLSALASQVPGRCVNIVDAYGHLPVGELAALLKHARLLVSNDTGVSHIASALRIPSVVVFSPYSNFSRWRPLDTRLHTAVPVDRAHDEHHVMQIIREKLLLDRNRKPLPVNPAASIP